MHDPQGLFCKTGKLWIIRKIPGAEKKTSRAEPRTGAWARNSMLRPVRCIGGGNSPWASAQLEAEEAGDSIAGTRAVSWDG